MKLTQIHQHPHLDDKMFKKVQDWMKIDNYEFGSTKKSMSNNDKRAMTILEKTTKLVDGHYQTAFLKREEAFLPNRRWLAEKQLKFFNNKLQKIDTSKQKLRNRRNILKNGYVVNKINSRLNTATKVWYLPHHP